VPIYNIGSPIAAGLGGAQAYLDAVTKKKQEEYQRQQTAMAQARQAQIDAQNKAYQDEQQAYQQAQLGMSRDAATRAAALDKARLNTMGYDASGNPISSPADQEISRILGAGTTPSTNAAPSSGTPSTPQTYPGAGGIGGNVTMSNGMTPSAYGATLGAAAGAAARPGAGTSNLPSLQSIAPTAPAQEPLTLSNLPTDRPLTYAEQQQFRAPLEDQLQSLIAARNKTSMPSEVSKFDRAIEGVRSQQQLVDQRLKDADAGYKANFSQQETAFERGEQRLPAGTDLPTLNNRLSTLQKRWEIENGKGYFDLADKTAKEIDRTVSLIGTQQSRAATEAWRLRPPRPSASNEPLSEPARRVYTQIRNMSPKDAYDTIATSGLSRSEMTTLEGLVGRETTAARQPGKDFIASYNRASQSAPPPPSGKDAKFDEAIQLIKNDPSVAAGLIKQDDFKTVFSPQAQKFLRQLAVDLP